MRKTFALLRAAGIAALLLALDGPIVPVEAQEAATAVRLLSGTAEAGWFGRALTLRLRLDGRAPFRAFTLDGPPRLVVDVEGAIAPGFDPAGLEAARPIEAARAGPVRPGWARLVLDLGGPFALASAELRAEATGGLMELRLRRVAAADFAAASGAPPGVWAPAARAAAAPAPLGQGPVTVAIDPGHGGPDPGAVRDGLEEKAVVLAFARDLAAALAATGRVRAVLTRDDDAFLGLGERVARARAAGADAFLSIHTNAAAETDLAGAIVFTRGEAGPDRASADRARLENRADSLGAADSAGAGDAVRAALAGMARPETDARSALLADALVEALEVGGGPLAPFPRRAADFIVLGASELPSALLELGFLSNAADRARMTDPAWRAGAAAAVAAGVEDWLVRDAALAARLRR